MPFAPLRAGRFAVLAVLAAALAAPMTPAPASASDEIILAQDDRRFLPRIFGGRKKDDEPQSDVLLRLDQLESQVRTLTGEVERLSFQLQQMQQLMLQAGVSLPQTGAAPAGQPGGDPLAAPGATGSAALGVPPQTLGTLGGADAAGTGTGAAPPAPGDAGGGPIDLSALNRGVPSSGQQPQSPGTAASTGGAAQAAFDNARALYIGERFLEAESEFRRFVETYPEDPRIGEAQYWIGESLLRRGDHRAAANAFLESYTDDPDGPKAPESLLQLGVSLEGMGEVEAACSSYEELLGTYPNAPESVQQRARERRGAAGCS